MLILDRYLLRQFLQVFFICFCSMTGLFIVIDGFGSLEEFISYALYQVRSREEAVEWASRFMRVHLELWPGWEGDATVLKVMGPEDFGPPPA